MLWISEKKNILTRTQLKIWIPAIPEKYTQNLTQQQVTQRARASKQVHKRHCTHKLMMTLCAMIERMSRIWPPQRNLQYIPFLWLIWLSMCIVHIFLFWLDRKTFFFSGFFLAAKTTQWLWASSQQSVVCVCSQFCAQDFSESGPRSLDTWQD